MRRHSLESDDALKDVDTPSKCGYILVSGVKVWTEVVFFFRLSYRQRTCVLFFTTWFHRGIGLGNSEVMFTS